MTEAGMIAFPPTCPHCQSAAKLDTGLRVYSRDYGMIWICANYPACDSYVGTHKNSREHKPLGTLANAELRKLRIECHATFDPIWKSGSMSRRAAYRHLADLMGIPPEKAHISWFDARECRAALVALTGDHEKAGAE